MGGGRGGICQSVNRIRQHHCLPLTCVRECKEEELDRDERGVTTTCKTENTTHYTHIPTHTHIHTLH